MKDFELLNKNTDDGAAAYVAELLDCPTLADQITHHRLVPGASAEFAQSRLPWSGAMQKLMAEKSIRLYTHQALAMDHIRAGHSVIVATPTASGKSLIYNLPVHEKFLRDPEATALYLFPLKALAQDQLAAFGRMSESWPRDARPSAALYDGDTPDHQRRKIRNSPPTALLTNPEMLHMGILPHHEAWTTFLANLSYVIVDEAHTYRGVFGSHMAQVFRRLNRVAARYGADPVYIFCSATLGNPAELATALKGGDEPIALVNKSGAPQGPRNFLFIDPLKAPATCAIDLLKRALEHGLRTIVYCQSRKMTELIGMWADGDADEWKGRISAYRAGYMPEERRKIEADMASGDLMAVISTSALELGIDIGGLDVCILVGYPGTVMQTLQRGGRVGRALQESAIILVAAEDALDQFVVHNPEDFFSRPPERAVVNPHNEVIMGRHLECAAAELPLSISEKWLKSPAVNPVLEQLKLHGALAQSADGTQWLATRKSPHRDVDLRGSGQSYSIEDKQGAIIGSMDACRAWKEAHPGAVYIHHGRAYVIDEMDSGRMRIIAREESVKWHTRVRCKKITEILREDARISLGNCAIFKGRLRITETITGYEKRTNDGNRLINITPMDVPPLIFETEGLWYVIPDSLRLELEAAFVHFMGSIHALEHTLIGLMPLQVMADRNDFGGISVPLHEQLGLPAIFVYDGLPGGAGLTAAAFECGREMLEAARKAIMECACEDGCPSCVQSPKCGAGNRPLSKLGALELLAGMLSDGAGGDSICSSLVIPPASEPLPMPEITVPGQPENVAKLEAPTLVTGRPVCGPPEHYVVFDVETRRGSTEVGGWSNADKMGVSVAVLYDSLEDRFITYEEHELDGMFERMAVAHVVIGFNSIRFDYQVLSPFAAKFQEGKGLELNGLPSLDLLRRIQKKLGYRVSLDNLGKATLNAPKSADGLQALRWWKQGEIGRIAEYCRQDVRITRDLYLYGLKRGCLFFSNKAGKKTQFSVDFQYSRDNS